MTYKSYLEIFVPLDTKRKWYSELKEYLSDVDVMWQNAYYHITMAFLDETPKDLEKITSMLKRHLTGFCAPVITFDSLDAFTTPSGLHFITLTSSAIPKEFVSLTDTVRHDIIDAGGKIESEFKPHVTLGRVRESNISLEYLQSKLRRFVVSPIELTLTEVDFRKFRGEVLFKTTLPI